MVKEFRQEVGATVACRELPADKLASGRTNSMTLGQLSETTSR
jgi:hypothetical protein